MSAPALPPTAPTTLVILLGASAWPNSPGFQASKAFVHAAQEFRDYMLDSHGFGLPPENLLDMFDAASNTSDQLEQLSSFLEERAQVLKAAEQAVHDVLVYFVGHGGFAGPSADFYLLPRRTNASSLRASGMAIDALAEVLREKARQTRRYMFLDCCFAAAAFRYFQGGPDQTAIAKTLDAFAVQAKSRGFPGKGTVLLCSSDQKSPSLLLPDESCTMFSYALLDVLRNGDLHRPLQLTLRDIKDLAEDRLAALPEKNVPRLSLHSPDQSEGDVAEVPLFPNSRAKKERHQRPEEVEQSRLALERRMQNTTEKVSPMLSQLVPPTTSPHASIPSQRSTMPPSPPTSVQPQRRRSPLIVVSLILLILILLGGMVYGAATGKWPWRVDHEPSTPTLPAGRHWTPQNAGSAQLQNLSKVIWAGSQFVAIGFDTILTSPDGRTWTVAQYTGPAQALSDVAWSGTQFVAVGVDVMGSIITGNILTSPDGRTWTAPHRVTTQTLSGVAWSGTQFVAVGGETADTTTPASSIILTSPDGHAWTVQHANTTQDLSGVAWSGKQFVAVGVGGTILTSPDGRTWTAQHSDTTQDLRDVIWSGKQFVAVGFGSTILTSPDGRIWTFQNSAPGEDFDSVVWSGKQFVVVSDDGIILTSADGRIWTAQHTGTGEFLESVAWSGKQFVAVGSGVILTSADGRTWTAQHAVTTQDLYKVIWANSQFVAVGKNGTILTSADGHIWTAQYTGTTQALSSIAWSGKQFVVVGGNPAITTAGGALITPGSSIILTSADGHTWTAQHTGTLQTLWGVAWSGKQFVAVGGETATATTTPGGVTITPGSSIILTSPDGRIWTAQYAGTAQPLWGVIWADSQFVAVGAGVILTSPDGRTWTLQYASASLGFWNVAWSGRQFIAVGSTMVISHDGRTWTHLDTIARQYFLYDVVWLDSQFMIMGGDVSSTSSAIGGAILTSPDGRTWTAQHTVIPQALEGVAWSGKRFVVVGLGGTILTSP